MIYVLIGTGLWLAGVITIAVVLRLIEPGEDDLDEDARDEEPPPPDDEVETLDPWGRTPDWNWPRGWGDRNA